ncbi:hypothetical protein AW736_26420 [Termitidicoccus mucosus]|uniref:TraG P-loop domain-containing protein n=1 Tax=Termitidicoccus mucosus TaxID=1184151 RepID=A0A178IQ81_9BACT|nr:hypothetical protein AW736_26420 [Opitutaceae bacterium TSB47]
MNRHPPNGYFINDFIVWGAFKKNATITRGFVITPPDLRGAGDAAAAKCHEDIVKYLQSIALNIRVQFQWCCNADYSKALDAYEAATAKAKNPAEKKVRESTARYFRRMLKEKQLRREHLVLFVSQQIESAPPTLAGKEGLKSYYRAILKQFENQYDQHYNEIKLAFGDGVNVEPMNKRAHQLHTYLFFNPNSNEWLADANVQFNDRISIARNCMTSDINTDHIGRMYMDGHYHGLLILQNIGSQTYEGMINNLTKTSLLNYQITVNLQPLDTYQIMMREETEAQELESQGRTATTTSQIREDTIKRKRHAVSQLGEGHTRLFSTLFVVRVWNTDESKLAADMSALKQAITSIKSARAYDTHLEVTTLETFFATFPGNCFHPYDARDKELADEHVANLIPFSASFTGDLANAQALWLSSDRALCGVRFIVNGLVQSTGVAGGSRSGKSVKYNNLLYQTGPYFDYDVMVEEGASHTNYTTDHGEKPIVIQKSGNISINYLDTMGAPLDPEHLAYAISLATHFAGDSGDARLNTRRRAYLAYYINICYREAQEEWARKNPEANRASQREATAIHLWHRQRMTPDDTLFDAYVHLRDRIAANDGEVLEFMSKISEAEITHFIKDPQTAHLAERHAFSKFTTEQYPLHSELTELLRLRPGTEHDSGEVAELASLMDNWCATGEYGPLFDGYTNRRFDGRVVHFELAKADNNDLALRGAIALNITGRIRQRIVTMPRKLVKRFTMEELARIVQMPGGAKLALELSAQLAKYNCVFAFILQDFAQIAHIEGVSTLLNNTRQWLITRHDDAKEFKEFAARIQLPDGMRDSVEKLPIPLNMPPNKRYSSACYFSRSAIPPISGITQYSFDQNAA